MCAFNIRTSEKIWWKEDQLVCDLINAWSIRNIVGWWSFSSLQQIRSYQDGYWLVIIHLAFGSFIVLPYYEIRTWHNHPISNIILTLNYPVLILSYWCCVPGYEAININLYKQLLWLEQEPKLQISRMQSPTFTDLATVPVHEYTSRLNCQHVRLTSHHNEATCIHFASHSFVLTELGLWYKIWGYQDKMHTFGTTGNASSLLNHRPAHHSLITYMCDPSDKIVQ